MPRYVDRFGDAVRGAIRAYHGSPHNFDKFDASRIGTGEGAQMYGHGLYFAGNEDVAKFYRNNVRSGTLEEQDFIRRETAKQARLYQQQDALREALEEQARRYGSPSEGWGDLNDIPDTDEVKAIQNRLRFLQADIDETTQNLSAAWRDIEARPGHMYEVDISVNPKSLLDWDAPVDAQGSGVINALQSLGVEAHRPSVSSMRPGGPLGTRGESAYKQLSLMLPGGGGDAARALREAGVPGVRYLDASSRRAGVGTRNYVMFPGTEDSIRILRKYGLLPATLGAEGVINQRQPAE